MNVEVKDKPSYHVACVRHVGPYPEIGKAFERLFQWAGSSGVLDADSTTLGVYWDDPDSTPEHELRSDACVTVPDGTSVGEGLSTQVIEGGRFAVSHAVIYNNDFRTAWKELHEWIAANGLALRNAVCYEIYLNNAMEDPDHKWIVDICIPVG